VQPHSRAFFEGLDRADPLAHMREEFITVPGEVYLDGNSLGAPTRRIAAVMERVVTAEWGQHGIRAWLADDWITLAERVGARIAKLVGAESDEVIIADSTSVGLFKMAAAARRLRPDRPVLLTEAGNFPTDAYVLQGLARLLGPGTTASLVARESLFDAIDDTVAVVVLTHVHYKTGELLDMQRLTHRAHEAGALIVWDLSHSTGALPVSLRACDVDFAVGCTYKFLNGGPGSPAFMFVARRLQDEVEPAIYGWMGHEAPFDFSDHFAPVRGIRRHLTGTHPVIALKSLDAALDVFNSVTLEELRAKSQRLGALFIEHLEAVCATWNFRVACPRDGARRGSQVSFGHPNGYPIMRALVRRGVIGDFRAPDILRFGLTPLYTRYADVYDAVNGLAGVMRNSEWDSPEFRVVGAVT
jgi:kynureninase